MDEYKITAGMFEECQTSLAYARSHGIDIEPVVEGDDDPGYFVAVVGGVSSERLYTLRELDCFLYGVVAEQERADREDE